MQIPPYDSPNIVSQQLSTYITVLTNNAAASHTAAITTMQ